MWLRGPGVVAGGLVVKWMLGEGGRDRGRGRGGRRRQGGGDGRGLGEDGRGGHQQWVVRCTRTYIRPGRGLSPVWAALARLLSGSEWRTCRIASLDNWCDGELGRMCEVEWACSAVLVRPRGNE